MFDTITLFYFYETLTSGPNITKINEIGQLQILFFFFIINEHTKKIIQRDVRMMTSIIPDNFI